MSDSPPEEKNESESESEDVKSEAEDVKSESEAEDVKSESEAEDSRSELPAGQDAQAALAAAKAEAEAARAEAEAAKAEAEAAKLAAAEALAEAELAKEEAAKAEAAKAEVAKAEAALAEAKAAEAEAAAAAAPAPAPAPSAPATGGSGGAGAAAAAPTSATGGAAMQALPGETFLQRLKKGKVSAAIMLTVVAIFILQYNHATTTIGVMAPFHDLAYGEYGGYLYPRVRDHGEWWRFFTTLVVPRHGLGLFIFIWLFFEYGFGLERALGSLRFLGYFLLTGAASMAVGELLMPVPTAIGTWVGVFGLTGAVPGAILGMTGSIGKTLADPMGRWSLFFALLWGGLYYFLGASMGMPINYPSILGSIVIGIVVGAAFGYSTRRLVPGLVAIGVVGALCLSLVGLVSSGKVIRQGELVDRGKPATGPTPGASPGQSASEAKVAELTRKLRAPALKVLERFGPLPFIPETTGGLSDSDYEVVNEALTALDAAVADSTDLTTELDDLRVRANLLLGRHTKAYRLAEALEFDPRPQAQALRGVAFYAHGDYQGAIDILQQLAERSQVEGRLPEVRYYLGSALFKDLQDKPSLEQFRRYLALVSEDGQPGWRENFIRQARAQLR